MAEEGRAITKDEAKREVAKLVTRFQREVENGKIPDYQEMDIRSNFIDRLFEVLGWKVYDHDEVIREQSTQKGKRADYVFRLNNKSAFIVEAKAANVNLESESEEKTFRQAIDYAYYDQIKFAVATNFKRLFVFHALSHPKNPKRNLLHIPNFGYFDMKFEEFPARFEQLWLLSRESFLKNELEKFISEKDIKTSKPVDKVILDDLVEIRKILSSDIKIHNQDLLNKYKDEANLIEEAVQRLINRLIFIRYTEDMGLEEKELLRNTLKRYQDMTSDKRLYAEIRDIFIQFNEKYNSHLFHLHEIDNEIKFSETALEKTIKLLYTGMDQNQAEYDFSKISVDLLGSIYEQYLGMFLRSSEKRAIVKEAEGKRKKMGIYYTPEYVVDYIIKNTICEAVKDKNIDEILRMKILDPACGSGSFLQKAFNEVCSTVEKRMKSGEKSEKPGAFKNEYKGRLQLGQKIDVLKKCIHGVDLDEKAVEIAQLSLLLKLLYGEESHAKKMLLPTMTENIQHGNSLIDDPEVAGKDLAFNWNARFKDVFAQGGFDIVVGNPPYGLVFNDSEKQYLEEHLPTFKRNNDLYVAFIEKSITLLKEGGLFAFIIPNTYLIGSYFEHLKKYVLDNTVIVKILDFGKNQVFNDPNVFNSIIILRKEENKSKREENKIKFYDIPLSQNLEIVNLEKISMENKIHQSQFYDLSWKPKNAIIENMNKGSTYLEDICYVKDVGFNYWSIGRGKKRGDSIGSRILYDGNRIDKDDTPYLKGRDMVRYGYVFGNHWLKHDYSKYLDEKVDTFRFSSKFLETTPKIIYRQTADRIIATMDFNKYYLDKTVHLIVPKEGKNPNMLFLLGVLNSKLLTYFYRDTTREEGRTFAQVKTIYIKKIPLKFNDVIEKKIESLADRMLSFNKRAQEPDITSSEKESIKKQIDDTNFEIDEFVYKLYEITDEEKKVVEESLK